ncbi:DUF4351 domain-containing protein [Crocosphaera chwakensis]|uniref:DUF4351 domain-containing protein n=1 Tax=Crocosphaera chwakensis CCY0110 TaxID=391612 RepID=A3IVW5_9CHRO|nr:DUF4351 domain-containing protein [Crocosphaera chwakensis]EAZ89351.1 hypothetical protein CY0110_30760 [Crocosphaera chwakensis CCY0110]
MEESVIYQDIIAKGELKVILRQIKRRFGELPSNTLSQVRGLSVEQLEELGFALLEFQSEEDLRKWLDK